MEALVLKIAAIVGALSTIFAFVWKPIKAVHDRRKKEKADLAAYRAGVAEAIARLEKKLDDNEKKLDAQGEDMAYQQRYELKTAHARLVYLGWCSDAEKSAVLDLYDFYSDNRKRNSLVDSYRRDIESLPSQSTGR